jgi:hypothetical protein
LIIDTKLVSASKPRLHPGLAEVHRRKVAALQDALASEGGLEIQEAIRGLVEAILLMPQDRKLAIEVRGDLAAILSWLRGRATTEN